LGNLTEFVERYREINEGFEHLKYVAIISGEPEQCLYICICLDEKKPKLGFVHLLYKKGDPESFSMDEFVGLLSYFNNVGCRVEINLQWTKERELWDLLVNTHK